MTDILQEDRDKARREALNAIQDKQAFYEDVRLTFGSDHGRRVLDDIADDKYMYDSLYTGNAQTYYNTAIQDYIRRILDIVAIADPDTYQWIMMQRASELRGRLTEEINSVRREE